MALAVDVTVMMGARAVPLADVKDQRVATAFRAAAADLGKKLEAIRCPAHGKAASRVRLRFDARGGIDLQYDSCCEKLGEVIGQKLG